MLRLKLRDFVLLGLPALLVMTTMSAGHASPPAASSCQVSNSVACQSAVLTADYSQFRNAQGDYLDWYDLPGVAITFTMLSGDTIDFYGRMIASVAVGTGYGMLQNPKILCSDSAGSVVDQVQTSRNNLGTTLQTNVRLLLKAPYAGTFTCKLQARTSGYSGSKMTVLGQHGSTVNTILNAYGARTSDREWGTETTCALYPNLCNGYPNRIYIGPTTSLKAYTMHSSGLVANAATLVGKIDINLTTCLPEPANDPSPSCPPQHQGTSTFSKVDTFIVAIQLNADGSECSRTIGDDPGVVTIDSKTHHIKLYHNVSAPVKYCGGSRRFVIKLWLENVGGNTVQVDALTSLPHALSVGIGRNL